MSAESQKAIFDGDSSSSTPKVMWLTKMLTRHRPRTASMEEMR